jgi:cytochrome c oxidase subunit 1
VASRHFVFETPRLWACAFIFVFSLGGFSGVALSLAVIDIQLKSTYYVVAHFHYVMVAGSVFAITAGVYYWLPKWTGQMYDDRLAKTQFCVSLVAFNFAFFPMHFMGLAGMPRWIPDYSLQFADLNLISSSC